MLYCHCTSVYTRQERKRWRERVAIRCTRTTTWSRSHHARAAATLTFHLHIQRTNPTPQYHNARILHSLQSCACILDWNACVRFACSPMPSLAHAVYFWFSLTFLITRTLAVSLYAADINDESKKPTRVLRAVPRESWCLEVGGLLVGVRHAHEL